MYKADGVKIYFTCPDGRLIHRASSAKAVSASVAALFNSAAEAKIRGRRDVSAAFLQAALKSKGFRWVKGE